MDNNTPLSAVIVAIRPLTSNISLLTLRTDPDYSVARSFVPGQFLQLSLPGVGEIPISYCGYPATDGIIELCIRHVGHVSNALKVAVPGQVAGLRGAFGNGFPLNEFVGRDLLLIAGGLGIAPLRSLLLNILKQREQYGVVKLIYGAHDATALLFLDELLEMKKWGKIELLLAVDSSERASDLPPSCQIALLPALLKYIEVDASHTCAAICGPPQVYPCLVTVLQELGIGNEQIYLSLERRMKCGVGRCGHCAVGNYLCCVNGPVFSMAALAGIRGVLA